MKLTRRGALGAAIAAPMAAAIPKTQQFDGPPVTYSHCNFGSGPIPETSPMGENALSATPDLAYWRERKKWAEKILAGDFSETQLTTKGPFSAYHDLEYLKSPSLAAKRMIIVQRELDAAKKNLIRDAMQVIDTCKKLFGFNLGNLFNPNG
jgi:hypothetical protein